ncbi:MAG: TetR/AcrR family transcriptional regulator [Clostridiales bacterium]|nr:TetR/AcrR family transcriptional regulator [Clostridiales bacterium]
MENQRIRLSKEMLKTGLLKLLKEKPVGQITVHELCIVSQINRTTFYKYYGSQTELLNEIESDFLNQLDESLKEIITQNSNALLLVLQYLYEQRELFCILTRSVPVQEFSAHVFSIPNIRVIFQSMINESNYSDTEVKYIRRFVFEGAFSVLYSWLNSEDPEPAAEIADVLGLLKDRL